MAHGKGEGGQAGSPMDPISQSFNLLAHTNSLENKAIARKPLAHQWIITLGHKPLQNGLLELKVVVTLSDL